MNYELFMPFVIVIVGAFTVFHIIKKNTFEAIMCFIVLIVNIYLWR